MEKNYIGKDKTVVNKKRLVKRGEVYWANLEKGVGSEQQGKRPVVIVSNEIGNKHSPTCVVVCLSSKLKKSSLPTHVDFPKSEGVKMDSIALCEQIRTIDKARLESKIATVSKEKMKEIDHAIKIALQLNFGFDEEE